MHGAYYTHQHIVTGTCVPRCVMRCRRRPKRVPRACGTCSCGAGPDRDPRTVYYYFARCLARGGRALARPEATKAARRLTRQVVTVSRSTGEAAAVRRCGARAAPTLTLWSYKVVGTCQRAAAARRSHLTGPPPRAPTGGRIQRMNTEHSDIAGYSRCRNCSVV